jgi:hypothetical protein
MATIELQALAQQRVSAYFPRQVWALAQQRASDYLPQQLWASA